MNDNKSHISLLNQDYYSISKSNTLQKKAILFAKKGKCIVIQGPPGTGKSQTIINIIAENLATEKKTAVLSKKKAALQVILQKLQKANLAHLSAFSFAPNDNKSLVHEVKRDLEKAINTSYPYEKIKRQRTKLIEEINATEKKLSDYHATMTTAGVDTRAPIYQLLQESFAFHQYTFSPNKTSYFSYDYWSDFKKEIIAYHSIKQNTRNNLPDILQENVLLQPMGKREWEDNINASIKQTLTPLNYNAVSFKHLEDAFRFSNDLLRLPIEEESFFLDLTQTNSLAFKTLCQEKEKIKALKNDAFTLYKKTRHWYETLNKNRIVDFIIQLNQINNEPFSLFKASYWKLRKEIQVFYKKRLPLSIRNMVSNLKKRLQYLDINEEIRFFETTLLRKYKNQDIDEVYTFYHSLQSQTYDKVLHWLYANRKNRNEINIGRSVAKNFIKLQESISFLQAEKIPTIPSIKELLLDLKENYNTYSSLCQLYGKLYNSHRNFLNAVLEAPDAKYIHQRTLAHSLNPVWERIKNRCNNIDIEQWSQDLFEKYNALHKTNALYLNALQHNSFIQKYNFSLQHSHFISDDKCMDYEKLKKQRAFLKNEFKKTTRFKSIAEIVSSTEELMSELKPVWLLQTNMYETIFSETPTSFDTLIFDESSQIPYHEVKDYLAEGIQIIIVGDEHQLPPSTFFKSKDTKKTLDHSLLDAYKSKLTTICLQWHYRSIDEELIAFSNQAFYNSQLLTYPTIPKTVSNYNKIEINYANEAYLHYADVFKKPISYHFIKDSIYHKGVNRKEAAYVAALVKQLILSNKTQSLGIVTFSVEQKEAIQEALHKIDFFDQSLDFILEARKYKYKNYEDFIVRNLENVQGDEKDIIIVSTSYGLDEHGVLRLNLGPLNKEHGEKRLNVLFSRARKHIVIVSSLKAHQIQSDNKRLSLFKQYLNYAEKTSLGLWGIKKQEAENNTNFLIEDIKKELEKKGIKTIKNIGHTEFTCPLYLPSFKMCILIDNAFHYKIDNLVESYVDIPNNLSKKSWKIYRVFTLNWVMDKERELKKIERVIHDQYQSYFKQDKELVKHIEKLDKKEKELLFTKLLKQGKQSNYWEIAIDGHQLIIHYGKLGTEGSSLRRQTNSVAEAIRLKRKLIIEKERQGYKRV